MPRPVPPSPTRSPNPESLARYVEIIDRVLEANRERYRLEPADPFRPQLLVHDVLAEMKIPLPPFRTPGAKKALDLRSWLRKEGQAAGWRQTSASEALRVLNRGEPVLAVSASPRVMLVGVARPWFTTPEGDPLIAVGGNAPSSCVPPSVAFGFPLVDYFAHASEPLAARTAPRG